MRTNLCADKTPQKGNEMQSLSSALQAPISLHWPIVHISHLYHSQRHPNGLHPPPKLGMVRIFGGEPVLTPRGERNGGHQMTTLNYLRATFGERRVGGGKMFLIMSPRLFLSQ